MAWSGFARALSLVGAHRLSIGIYNYMALILINYERHHSGRKQRSTTTCTVCSPKVSRWYPLPCTYSISSTRTYILVYSNILRVLVSKTDVIQWVI